VVVMARTASGVFITRRFNSTGGNIENVRCAGGEKGHQLDDGFGGDRQHQAVLMSVASV